MTRTIYVNAQHIEVWNRAIDAADREGVSLSTYVANALLRAESATACHTCHAIRKLLAGRLDVVDDEG